MIDAASAELTRRHAAAVAGETAFPVVFASASGSRVTDLSGKSYLDFITGYGVVSTGHSRPEILQAIAEQARSGCFASPWLPTRQAVELAEELLALGSKNLRCCARASGGADAVETATRAHRAARGGKVLVVGRAYHGGTSQTLAQSDAVAFHLPRPSLPESPRVPPAYCHRCDYGKSHPGCAFKCVQAIDAAIAADPDITAILLEPILGSGGVIVPPAEYFPALMEIVRRRKLILIVDEVMTGCGRIGAWTASQALGLEPDALIIAKGLGGGSVPIGTAMLTEELADGLRKYEDVSATLAWTPLACAATLANVRLIQAESLPERAAAAGESFLPRVRELFERRLPRHTGEVRGMGLMIGVELVKDRTSREPHPSLLKRLALLTLRRGLMIGTSWDWHTLILMPPLNVTDDDLDEALRILDESLQRMNRSQGDAQ